MMTAEEIFDKCVAINNSDDDIKAREELFKLLDVLPKDEYTPILNHTIRKFGFYPYMNGDSSIFMDRLAIECFKIDSGDKEPKVLHKEQSKVLKKLLSNENLILSAPTSFGKSFIIDALIAIKKPNNILIIVPTISLMDETRRRLFKKFHDYNIITTIQEDNIQDKNIFIFSQERAIEYFTIIDKNKLKLDLFVVDEFYKISPEHNFDRAYILQNAIAKYSKISKQRYYLCPNINKINKNNIFCKNMNEYIIDTNTVFIDIHETYLEKDFVKEKKLFEIITKGNKTLLYAQSQNSIKKISNIIIDSELLANKTNDTLRDFANWLDKYYGDYYLNKILRKGVGIHHGKLHRNISQLQVRLFEEKDVLDTIISTSSLIEGVNIPARNLILWDKKIGKNNLTSFTYKNIIGRSGRMFKYFVGNVYLFDKPPKIQDEELVIQVESDSISMEEDIRNELTESNKDKILQDEKKIKNLVGESIFKEIKKSSIKNNNEVIIELIEFLKSGEFKLEYLQHLLTDNPNEWFFINILASKIKALKSPKYRLLNLMSSMFYNWQTTLPELIKKLNINLDLYFELENHMTFKVASIFSDLNELQKIMYKNKNFDLTPFITRLSNAFLPSCVFTLEEFGLPRFISKKLHECEFINFENNDLKLQEVLKKFKSSSVEDIIKLLQDKDKFDNFDEYIIRYFYEGLTVEN